MYLLLLWLLNSLSLLCLILQREHLYISLPFKPFFYLLNLFIQKLLNWSIFYVQDSIRDSGFDERNQPQFNCIQNNYPQEDQTKHFFRKAPGNFIWDVIPGLSCHKFPLFLPITSRLQRIEFSHILCLSHIIDNNFENLSIFAWILLWTLVLLELIKANCKPSFFKFKVKLRCATFYVLYIYISLGTCIFSEFDTYKSLE